MKQIRLRTVLSLAALGLATGAMAACLTANLPYSMRVETARRLATPSFMIHREIPTARYMLTSYERVRQEGQSATIYIEGDAAHPDLGPTPTNPVALHMATRDNGPNVIYLARPCQYTQTVDHNEECTSSDWREGRYGADQLEALNAALEDIRKRYKIRGFNLVGYEGGGAMAVLLASARRDILTIRTVAGILDTNLYDRIHNPQQTRPLTGLNPVSVARQVAHIPQNHFTGLWDEKTTTAIYDSFYAASGKTTCMRNIVIGKADHQDGWVNKWPILLDYKLDCQKFD